MRKILVVLPMSGAQRERLEKAAPDFDYVYMRPREVTERAIVDAEVIIGNVRPADLRYAKKLRWLQLNSAGQDDYTGPGVLPEGVRLTNASGAYGLAVSEHMLALTLMLCRKLDLYMREQVAHHWKSEGRISSIFGSSVLVLGYGDIGSAYGVRCRALGAHVIGIRRDPAAASPGADEVYAMESLDELLPSADIVAMALPSTGETRGLIGRRRLSLMKDSAYLVNCGRGDAVDMDALDSALRLGRIGGAALDVTVPEPLPEEHPLWEAPRCIITPHVAGNLHLDRTVENIVDIAAARLREYAGETRRRDGPELRKCT